MAGFVIRFVETLCSAARYLVKYVYPLEPLDYSAVSDRGTYLSMARGGAVQISTTVPQPAEDFSFVFHLSAPSPHHNRASSGNLINKTNR
jgi:hypothetical protein